MTSVDKKGVKIAAFGASLAVAGMAMAAPATSAYAEELPAAITPESAQTVQTAIASAANPTTEDQAKSALDSAQQKADAAKSDADNARADYSNARQNAEKATKDVADASTALDQTKQDANAGFANNTPDAAKAATDAAKGADDAQKSDDEAAKAVDDAQSVADKAASDKAGADANLANERAANPDAEARISNDQKTVGDASKAVDDATSKQDAAQKTADAATKKADDGKTAVDNANAQKNTADTSVADTQKKADDAASDVTAKQAIVDAGANTPEGKAVTDATAKLGNDKSALDMAKTDANTAAANLAHATSNLKGAQKGALETTEKSQQSQVDADSATVDTDKAALDAAQKTKDNVGKAWLDQNTYKTIDGWIAQMKADTTTRVSYNGATMTMSAYIAMQEANGNLAKWIANATSTDAIQKSIDSIKECNRLRAAAGADPVNGGSLAQLKVSPNAMAFSAISSIASNMVYDHVLLKAGYFWAGENLAWGYSDPFSGWYTEEKAEFDAGATDFSRTGHYQNIVSSIYDATGFAWNGRTSEQSFLMVHGYTDTGVADVAIYEANFKAFVVSADTNLAAAKTAYSNALAKLSASKAALASTRNDLKAYAGVTSNHTRVEVAQGAVNTAQAAKTAADTKVASLTATVAADQQALNTAKSNLDVAAKKARANLDAAQAVKVKADANLASAKTKAAIADADLAAAQNAYDEAVAEKTAAGAALASAKTDTANAQTTLASARAQMERDKVTYRAYYDAKAADETAAQDVATAAAALEAAKSAKVIADRALSDARAKLVDANSTLAAAKLVDRNDPATYETRFPELAKLMADIHSAQQRLDAANMALTNARSDEKDDEAAYQTALDNYARAAADLAFAQSNYDRFVAEEKAAADAVTPAADTRVVYDDAPAPVHARYASPDATPKTGDGAPFGAMLLTALGGAILTAEGRRNGKRRRSCA